MLEVFFLYARSSIIYKFCGRLWMGEQLFSRKKDPPVTIWKEGERGDNDRSSNSSSSVLGNGIALHDIVGRIIRTSSVVVVVDDTEDDCLLLSIIVLGFIMFGVALLGAWFTKGGWKIDELFSCFCSLKRKSINHSFKHRKENNELIGLTNLWFSW